MNPIDKLVEISRFYGSQKESVLAGGGNTSYKDMNKIWVKASGISLSSITRERFVVLRRDKLDAISTRKYDSNPDKRERQVKEDLHLARINPDDPLRPSVETSFHNLIRYAYVVHLHPTLVNGLLCSRDSADLTLKLFGREALYIPYTDPGYTLFKKIENELRGYRKQHNKDPNIIFLENHGLFISNDDPEEIRRTYDSIIRTISRQLEVKPVLKKLPDHKEIKTILPALRMLLSDNQGKILKYRHNSLIRHFYDSQASFKKASLPLCPDMIVYCKSDYLYIHTDGTPDDILHAAEKSIGLFKEKNKYYPAIIMIRNFGLVAAEEDSKSAETTLDVYEDLMKISLLSNNFGGPRFMNQKQIGFITGWEVEHYRKAVAKGSSTAGLVQNKIAVVTGGAQGFGAGIVEDFFRNGANVVIADLNEKKGKEMAQRLNEPGCRNHCVHITADVSDPNALKSMILTTVKEFGGLDLLISNAGILHAGSLEEIDPSTFEKMTRVNYSAYYLCVKYSSEIFRIQHQYKNDYFTDIIQINSKSGLTGSKKNFAYAGAKFGGVGLTQSFALELLEYNIKVNAVCPGNFFEGPLWSDPKRGLFRQYLEAGKVPGAKTIEDVRNYYEQLVPMKRGCTVADIMKTIYYLIDQQYETGQALPVTGGQIMLN
ncbi:MAG: hypothetical protein AMS27_09035 [Bacteroides sp. SM23_62_1]|nr:MAG: hypothetical protein AMS27_09035 [Bacteroides sp. SM23_62_1]